MHLSFCHPGLSPKYTIYALTFMVLYLSSGKNENKGKKRHLNLFVSFALTDRPQLLARQVGSVRQPRRRVGHRSGVEWRTRLRSPARPKCVSERTTSWSSDRRRECADRSSSSVEDWTSRWGQYCKLFSPLLRRYQYYQEEQQQKQLK